MSRGVIHESKSTAIGTNGTRAEHGTRNVKIVLSVSQMVPCLRWTPVNFEVNVPLAELYLFLICVSKLGILEFLELFWN